MLTVRVVPRPGAVLRALLATAEIVLGTMAAHTWAGGTLPSAAWLAAITALVLVASLVVLRGRVRATVAVPALAGAQLLLHCWLVALAPGHTMSGHTMSGHTMSGHTMPGPHLELTMPMLAAHLAGAALTAVVWGVRRRAIEVVLAWVAWARVLVSTPRAVAVVTAPHVSRRVRVLELAPRRGPPGLPAPA